MSENDVRVVLADLATRAFERARTRGHALGAWQERRENGTTSATASCTICGRIVYLRIEGALAGASGDALVEPCTG